ncbi:MAG: hypothetical protein ACK4UW_01135 [Rhizobium rhizophilum]|uniref:hypothetical protein n=1 Tax=Rhizobium rhizophilum TaxID=1850373 RepID=UPI00391BFF6F
MLAGHLVAIASDILRDYDELEVIPTLESGVNLAVNRGSMSSGAFTKHAGEIVSSAERILEDSIVAHYPSDLRQRILRSPYSQAMPDALARVLIAGFRGARKAETISSPELSIYLEEARSLYRFVTSLSDAAHAFSIEEYDTPEECVALEIKIPDLLYGRSLNFLPKKLESIEKFLLVVEEVLTGQRTSQKIIWVSTTDLVVTIAWAVGSIGGFLYVYERLLGLAEKHLSIIKLVKDLRSNALVEDDEIEERIKATVQRELQKAVREIVDELSPVKTTERKNELKIELELNAGQLIRDIATGLRFNVSSRDLLSLSEVPYDEDLREANMRRLAALRTAELKLEQELRSLETGELRLLTEERRDA